MGKRISKMTEWKIRKVEERDLKRYKELTDIEGWNHGQDMFDFVFGSKGKAYCLELSGKLISFCGYFELSEDAFLIISYITDKEYRGMGYGSKCFKAVMDDCKGKKLLINSADGKQEMYGRSGFKTFIFDDYQLVAKAKLITDDTGLESIREYSEQDFDKLAEYDRKISPYDRTHLLPFFLKTS